LYYSKSYKSILDSKKYSLHEADLKSYRWKEIEPDGSKLHSFSWFLSEDETQNQNIVEPHRYSMTGFDGKNLLLFSDRNRILRIKAISPIGSSEI